MTRTWTRRGACALSVLMFALPIAAAGLQLAGLPLSAALQRLRDAGLEIIFSDALVSDSMVVGVEPSAADPRAALVEILRPHGLDVAEGPGGRLVVVRATEEAADSELGGIEGRLDPGDSPGLLEGAVIRVVGDDGAVAVDSDGRFVISGLEAGAYSLQVASPRARPEVVDEVVVRAGRTTALTIQLSRREVFSREIVITPSHFRILEREPEARQVLTRSEVDRIPHVADDLYRAVKRLPGAAGGDISARFNIRGGARDEMLVLLDGLELYEPFHLKDFQNVFSTIDAEAIGGVDFMTGGFPVEYGDRMSGVMDIALETPIEPRTITLSVGTLNARLLSEGLFDDGRGQWTVSGRAWYPAQVFDLVEESPDEILTDYYDLLARVQHAVGGHSTLSANVLASYDNLGFSTRDEDQVEDVKARYSSHHLWFNLKTRWCDGLFSQTVVSAGRLLRRRSGSNVDLTAESYEVDDRRDFEFVGLRQDWTFDLGSRHVVKWGLDLKHHEATYDYSSLMVVGDDPPRNIQVDLEPQGDSIGLYAADRFQIGHGTVAEVGLRWDRQGWIDDDQTSPRINLASRVGDQTMLRLGWGLFSQSERLNELQVEDGVTRFWPAQRAEQWVASLEQGFATGMNARLELHWKRYSDLRPRYENAFNPVELFPEAAFDRIRIAPDAGRAYGAELLVKSGHGSRLEWWLTYSLSWVEDRLDGMWVPRSWDQRHAATVGFNLALPGSWNLNLAAAGHSGFPRTPAAGRLEIGPDGELDPVLVIGPRSSDRYPLYLRLDARAIKELPTRVGDLRLVLEVINLTNRRNVCCVDDFNLVVREDGTVRAIPEESYWAPIVPSVSLRWTF